MARQIQIIRGNHWTRSIQRIVRGSLPALALVIVAAFGLGCVKSLGTESRALGRVEEDCVVPRPSALATWGAPVSIEYADRSLWVWPSVTLTGGEVRRNVAALVESVRGACDGELTLQLDENGGLRSLVELDDAEMQQNRDATDGRRLELAVTGGFVDQERAYVLYEKHRVGPGIFDDELIGSGLCVIDQPGGRCSRQRPTLHPGEPTLLWLGRRVPNRGAFVEDGYANIVSCLHVAVFQDICSVGRVPLAKVADPLAYQYRSFDDWTADPWNSATILESAGAVTPSYNTFLGGYVLVSADIFAPSIELRAGRTLWDGPQLEGRLFAAIAPKELWFIAGGVEHAGLRLEGGRSIAVSYFTDGEEAPGLHLVTFRFSASLAGGAK